MEKLKSIVNNQKNAVRNIFFRYIVTISSIALVSIIYVFLNTTHYRFDSGDAIDKVLSFLYLLAVGAFLIESVIKRERVKLAKPVTAYVINAVIALVLNIAGWELSGRSHEQFTKVVWFYIMLALGIGLYKIIRDSGLSFHKYSVKLIFGLIKVGSVFLILNIGVILILCIFDALIFDIDIFDIMENFEYLLLGFVYTPYLLICITDKKEEKSKFIKGLLLYALMPLVMIAVGIIYLYIIRIIVERSMPSNEVFNICAWLFVIGAFIWTMTYAYMEDNPSLNLYEKTVKNMKYIYAPFILLEIYAIVLRIHQHGLTETRYLGILFILFQIVYIAWEPMIALFCRVRKKSDEKVSYGQGCEGLIFVLIGIYFIGVLIPVVNGEYLSYLSQKARFKEAFSELKEAEGTDCTDAFMQYSGTYEYLSDNYYGEKYLTENYDKKELASYIQQFYSLGTDDIGYTWETVDIACESKDAEGIDISGYSKLYELDYGDYSGNEMDIDTLRSFDIHYGEDGMVSLDLTDCIRTAKEHDYYSYTAEKPYEYETEGGQKVILYSVWFRYSEELGLYESVRIEGYVLE